MARSITSLIQALDVMRQNLRNADLPIQQVLTFAYVADRGEIPQHDLIELTGVSHASVSRNVDRLGTGRPDDPGYGLLVSEPDPYQRTRKIVRLTKRGEQLKLDLDEAMTRY